MMAEHAVHEAGAPAVLELEQLAEALRELLLGQLAALEAAHARERARIVPEQPL